MFEGGFSAPHFEQVVIARHYSSRSAGWARRPNRATARVRFYRGGRRVLGGRNPRPASMEISLDLVTEAARRRLAAVTPEVAGYIVLLATRALEERLFRVSASSFALSETGEVRAHPEGRMSESEVEAALRDLLASLLSLSPSPSPAVVAVAERAESHGLRALTAELTAALIPINHAAAQRALARLFRETRRARDYYRKAERLFEYLSPAGQPILRAMMDIYGGLLARIERQNYDVYSRRISLPRWRKLWIAFQAFASRW